MFQKHLGNEEEENPHTWQHRYIHIFKITNQRLTNASKNTNFKYRSLLRAWIWFFSHSISSCSLVSSWGNNFGWYKKIVALLVHNRNKRKYHDYQKSINKDIITTWIACTGSQPSVRPIEDPSECLEDVLWPNLETYRKTEFLWSNHLSTSVGFSLWCHYSHSNHEYRFLTWRYENWQLHLLFVLWITIMQ